MRAGVWGSGDRLGLPVVGPARYRGAMAGWDEVTTYEQLQEMTPQERLAHFKASIVRDLDTLPERYKRRIEAQDARVLAREERLRGHAS